MVCGFTGHRPEKLTLPEVQVQQLLREQILQAVEDGFHTFISGMARGVDIWAAELVLQLRAQRPELRLVCACPYEGFETSWKQLWRERYRSCLQQADEVHYICPRYSRACFQVRNQWMVDRAGRVIAVFNGEAGGTKNTIEYAERKCVEVVCIGG